MVVHIDGDNVSKKLWPIIVRAFRFKYPYCIFTCYKLDSTITSKVRQWCITNSVKLVPVVPAVKESTDTHIVYSIAVIEASRPGTTQYVLSQDSGFSALSYINPNVSVLSPYQSVKWEKALLQYFSKKRNKPLDFCTVGSITTHKRYGFSSVRDQLKGSKLFIAYNGQVRLKG